MEILYLEVQALVHTTEDREKVIAALENLFPFPIELDSQRLSGQYGNSIELLKTRVTKKNKIEEFLGHICSALGEECRRLVGETGRRLSKGRFFVRFDKGKAYLGRARLGEGIQVELKVTSHPYREEKIKRELRELWKNVS